MNDMTQLAQRVAVFLPDWTPESNDNNLVGILRRPDGAGIYLRATHPYATNCRIEVSGLYPPRHNPQGPRHTISISPKRAPQDMAEDIQRRFLPAYDRLYAECLAAAENERRRLQDKIETTQRLANLLGVAYRPPDDATAVPKLSWSEGEFHAYVRTENGRVYLDRVSMSLEQFERMVAAIRDT
jgi:hypothetical protein